MAVLLSSVLATARTYLNDDGATQFPDPVLIPKIQEAHRELQEELWVIGSPIVRSQTSPSAPLHILAGSSQLSFLSAPPLPVDFLCPTAMFEGAWPPPSTPAGWNPVTEVFFMPLSTVGDTQIRQWAWLEEVINFTPLSVDRAVILQYRRQITIPNLATDPIGILFGESYLAARGAAMAAGTVGNADVFAALTALAKENLAKVISANRGQQKSSMKP